MSKPKGKQAVYIVTAGEDFLPQRPWDFPQSFTLGELHVRNLTMAHAHGFARTFNKRAVQQREQGDWDRRWAIVVKHVRSQRHGLHPLVERRAVT